MIIRIVKMNFEPENIDTFKNIFKESQPEIQKFAGCISVELLQDLSQPQIMMTYSLWQDEASLEAYRSSLFFEKTWRKTKALFAEKAQAWSYNQIS